MNRYSILIVALSLLGGGRVLAQANPDKEEAEKVKQETVKKEDKDSNTNDKASTRIKVVPAAKNKHAKPTKVSSARSRTARPGGNRPARNVRPSSRPARPANGRN